MKRFKIAVLFCYASAVLILFLPKVWSLVFLILSFVFLAILLHRWLAPLERIMDVAQEGKFSPLPIEKNSFTHLTLSYNGMAEKIQQHMHQTQRQDKELEGILNSLNEGVIALNVRSKVTFVNQKACKMLQISRGELLGRSLLYLGHHESFMQKCHEIVLHALQTSEEINEQWTSDGVFFDLVAAPLTHQEGAILVIQDKTSDYKVLEVGKNFIANASHEIRTPITIIRGFAEMLQQEESFSVEMKQDITGKIVRTCDRLDKLVKSLLTIADLEHFSVERFRPCNLMSLIDHCKHLFATAYPEVKLSVTGNENLSILGDFDLLDLAIMNLLENAVKYSAKTAHIHLRVQRMQNMVNIHVEDQGIGIPLQDLQHIFDRFYTVDKARSRKSGGIGLGLSIVKLIAEKHRGKISVTSEPGKGSTFTMAIPSQSI